MFDKKLKRFLFCVFFSVLAFFLYAEDELQELENLENASETQNVEECSSVLDCCNEIIIIESSVQHDLNPQTTSYTVDTAILSGLYEGLVSNNPKTLEPEFAIANEEF